MKRTALVLGGGGFIGGHLAKRLKQEGYYVRVVDIKMHEYFASEEICDEFLVYDLRDPKNVEAIFKLESANGALLPFKYLSHPFSKKEAFDEVYQLAADMGGAGYVFTGDNDANIMHNSSLINLNVVYEAVKQGAKRVFYSSSACMYPEYNQLDPNNPNCEESSAYPADPDSEYGWEKLFSERLYLAFARNYGLQIRIARFHNIFGPEGTYNGGKEKAPAAMCRKVAEALDGGEIEVWGDGQQTRSFLYIDECVEGVLKLMRSDFKGPVNIGSDEMIGINDLAKLVIDIAGKNIKIKNIPGFVGVRGRNSDNTLIKEKLGWAPHYPLHKGLIRTYEWISKQI